MAGRRRMKKYILLVIKVGQARNAAWTGTHPHPPGILVLLGLYPRCQPVPCALTHLQRPSQGFRHARGKRKHANSSLAGSVVKKVRCEGEKPPHMLETSSSLTRLVQLATGCLGDEQERQKLAHEAAPTPPSCAIACAHLRRIDFVTSLITSLDFDSKGCKLSELFSKAVGFY